MLRVPGIILGLIVVILEFYSRELGLSWQIKKQKDSLGEKGFILIHNSELQELEATSPTHSGAERMNLCTPTTQADFSAYTIQDGDSEGCGAIHIEAPLPVSINIAKTIPYSQVPKTTWSRQSFTRAGSRLFYVVSPVPTDVP